MKATDMIRGYLFIGTTYAAVSLYFISLGAVHFFLSLSHSLFLLLHDCL